MLVIFHCRHHLVALSPNFHFAHLLFCFFELIDLTMGNTTAGTYTDTDQRHTLPSQMNLKTAPNSGTEASNSTTTTNNATPLRKNKHRKIDYSDENVPDSGTPTSESSSDSGTPTSESSSDKSKRGTGGCKHGGESDDEMDLSDYEMVESNMENDDTDSFYYGAMLLEIVVAEQDTKIEKQEAQIVALQKRMEGANINSEDKVSTCETPWYQKRRCELYKHDLACRSGMSLSLNQVLFLLFLP